MLPKSFNVFLVELFNVGKEAYVGGNRRTFVSRYQPSQDSDSPPPIKQTRHRRVQLFVLVLANQW